jgi:hypothetical protein
MLALFWSTSPFYGLKRVSPPNKFSTLLVISNSYTRLLTLGSEFWVPIFTATLTYRSYHTNRIRILTASSSMQRLRAVAIQATGIFRSGRVQLPVLWSMPEHGLCWLLLHVNCEFVDTRQQLRFRTFSQYVVSNVKRNIGCNTEEYHSNRVNFKMYLTYVIIN